MSKFTPGPWRVDSAGNVVSESPGVVEKIAVSIFVGSERRKANAALIAQAPAMYEALKHALEDMDKIDAVCKLAGVHKFDLLRKELEAALRAADGGE